MSNNYVRGAVSGLGLVNIYAALAELSDLFRSRGAEEHERSFITGNPRDEHP
jgi:hypothetical protein